MKKIILGTSDDWSIRLSSHDSTNAQGFRILKTFQRTIDIILILIDFIYI